MDHWPMNTVELEAQWDIQHNLWDADSLADKSLLGVDGGLEQQAAA